MHLYAHSNPSVALRADPWLFQSTRSLTIEEVFTRLSNCIAVVLRHSTMFARRTKHNIEILRKRGLAGGVLGLVSLPQQDDAGPCICA